MRHTLILALAIMLAGCTIGPKYQKPSAPVPPSYKDTGAPNVQENWKPAQPADGTSRGEWWESFNDPLLNDLEDKLNISNQNIAAAAASVQVARAMIREARSQYYPTVAIAPSYLNSRVSNGFGRTIGVSFNNYTILLESSWEPDLWGRVRNTVRADTFAAQASAADLEDVRLAAQADLAADYYNLRAQDALKQLMDSTVKAYAEALDLTRDLYIAGLDSDEAVAQA